MTAVLISAAVGFYSIYHRVVSGRHKGEAHDHSVDDHLQEDHRIELDKFRAFLRSLLMHGAVGTALGGVSTLVGEPQNLLIGEKMGWHFVDFFIYMAPVSMPVLLCGLLTTIVLERTGWFGYGAQIPEPVFNILKEFDQEAQSQWGAKERAELFMQFAVAVFLIFALAFIWQKSALSA